MEIKVDKNSDELLIAECLKINKNAPYNKENVFKNIDVPEYLTNKIQSLPKDTYFKFAQWAKPINGYYKLTYELRVVNYQQQA